MSDTPRTDAEVVCQEVHGYGEFEDGWFVEADFARRLERENAKYRKALEEIASLGEEPLFTFIGAVKVARWAIGAPQP